MVMKRTLVALLTAALAAMGTVGAAMLAPQGAEASLVTVATCNGGTIQLNTSEKRVLDLHNKARTARGKKALCVHPTLTRAARSHSQEMLRKDYASHHSHNGETVKERLKRFGYGLSGYSYYAIGENIAWGCGSSGTPDRIVKWWMHSSVHRSNILNKRFKEVGVGVSVGSFKKCNQATMYTVDFGTRRR
jgi:uncharacterized protein YkwD